MCAPRFIAVPARLIGAAICALRGGHDWHKSSWIWCQRWPFPWEYEICPRCGRARGYPDGSKGWEE